MRRTTEPPYAPSISWNLQPGSQAIDETIARDFLTRHHPDEVINARHKPERNLYLTIQLLELRVPLIIALNSSTKPKH